MNKTNKQIELLEKKLYRKQQKINSLVASKATLRKRLDQAERGPKNKTIRNQAALYFLTIFLLIALSAYTAYGAFILGQEFEKAADLFAKDPYIKSLEEAEVTAQEQIEDNSLEGVQTQPQNAHQSDGTSASINAVVTAYCLNQQPMANGEQVHQGAVACPANLELGTRLTFIHPNGDKVSGYECTDRMGPAYRYNPERFDLWIESCDEAIKWGVKNIEIIKD